jgi:hypothetical protein
MSTWHQQQNPMPLWHDTLWTRVDDAPGRLTSVERFHTSDDAYKAMEKLGGYVLPSSNSLNMRQQ